VSAQVDGELEKVQRRDLPRLIAVTARIVGDVGAAEDVVQDAFLAALAQWPRSGVPDNPTAWLVAVARHRAVDYVRRVAMMERKQYQLVREQEVEQGKLGGSAAGDPDELVRDDLLRLIFVCCHPVLPQPARVALTLRLVGSLSTSEIARAFLVRESTMAQRIVRAKRTLAESGVRFELPDETVLQERLPDVLEVIYLIFNEGYAASSGEALTRPRLCHDALRLGDLLASLLPKEPEVLGLTALMDLQASRLPARVGCGGEPVLLADQDRTRWDRQLADAGLSCLRRAEELGGLVGPGGVYVLQAAIAACHARAAGIEETDWVHVAALYARLAVQLRSPVVELNRAVAVAMAFGPAAGLELIEPLREDPRMQDYHLLPSVRGDLLAKLGRKEEARAELARAVRLAENAGTRRWLEQRVDALQGS